MEPRVFVNRSEMPSPFLVSLTDLMNELRNIPSLLPISTSSLDVYELSSEEQIHTDLLTAAVQRDAALTAEVLRLANTSFNQSAQQSTADLDRAIQWIGRKRLGQLALEMSFLANLTSKLVPWLDMQMVWNQSLATGIAVELLIAQSGKSELEEGLLLSAIMHPLGRVVLGAIYPSLYNEMLKNCQLTGESLLEQERVTFPLSHTEVLSFLLNGWSLPKQLQSPLNRMLDDFAAFDSCPKTLRIKTELLKLAAFVSQMAVGQLKSWERIDIPSITLLKRLGIYDLNQVIEQTKADLIRLAAFHPKGPAMNELSFATPISRQLACCNFSELGFSFFEKFLPATGIQPVMIAVEALDRMESTVLVNCLGTAPQHVEAHLGGRSEIVIITDAEREEAYQKYATTITLPCSYGRLRDVCREISQPIASAHELVGTAIDQWS